jgi:adenine-specific DNA-methyltransferase
MNEQSNKLEGTTLDIPAENRTQLKALFPSVFTESKNEKGELVESVDFEKLKAEIGTFSDVFESRRERYGMDWPGKKESLRLIQTPSTATLKPCREESVNFDTTENLFIEGDNLEVLKLLQKSYYGKVKMIYIDPPYNTGKEFIYPDNYTESLDTYLEYAGLTDGEGKKFSTNTANEGRFHTKWLNMMYPRLYLARNLLKDDGVIFISIDDNEVSNLKKLCDEIFGEENFIANIVWQKKQSPQNDATYFSDMHDHILVYAKIAKKNRNDDLGWDRNLLAREEEHNRRYINQDNDIRGDWASVDITCNKTSVERPNLFYSIRNPNTKEDLKPSTQRVWRYEESSMQKLLEDGRIWWGENGNNFPRQKRFLSEVQDGIVPSTWWDREFASDNQAARRELRSLFREDEGDFNTPKPSGLIKRMLQIATNSNDIILDFFSGSATTAHAVLDLNKEDSGNRKFILVQLPEPCAPESEAFKAGFKTIADIGKERIRRVINKINKEQSDTLDLTDSGSQDLGFKVLKLDKSNFRQWQQLDPSTPPAKVEEELFKHIDHIDSNATPEDLLYEILLKAGFTPTEKIEIINIAGKTVYIVADNALLLCLENEVTKELIDAIANLQPMQFICLDSAFQGNDQLKANAVQTFAALNMQKEKHTQIIFKTV